MFIPSIANFVGNTVFNTTYWTRGPTSMKASAIKLSCLAYLFILFFNRNLFFRSSISLQLSFPYQCVKHLMWIISPRLYILTKVLLCFLRLQNKWSQTPLYSHPLFLISLPISPNWELCAIQCAAVLSSGICFISHFSHASGQEMDYFGHFSS